MSSLGHMTTTTPQSFAIGGGTSPAEYRFSVDEFLRLFAQGFFPSEARLELLEGVVVMMSPEEGPHFKSVMRCQEALFKLLPANWMLAVDRSLRLPRSVLEPDFMVLRGRIDEYESLPQAANVGLIVEVADSSRYYDQSKKATVYAAVGIPEYWIVNLVDRKLEVHRRPIAAGGDQPACYESIEAFGPDQSVSVVLDGVQVGTIAVRDILP